MTRRRWGITRNPQAWLAALGWTVAIGLCIASALVVPALPAVHV